MTSLIDRAYLAAFDLLIGQMETSLHTASEEDDRRFWQRQLNAARKARAAAEQSLRPTMQSAGQWLVASASRSGVVHAVKDGECSCEAGQHGVACWHAYTVIAMEIALSDLDTADDYQHDDSDFVRDTADAVLVDTALSPADLDSLVLAPLPSVMDPADYLLQRHAALEAQFAQCGPAQGFVEASLYAVCRVSLAHAREEIAKLRAATCPDVRDLCDRFADLAMSQAAAYLTAIDIARTGATLVARTRDRVAA